MKNNGFKSPQPPTTIPAGTRRHGSPAEPTLPALQKRLDGIESAADLEKMVDEASGGTWSKPAVNAIIGRIKFIRGEVLNKANAIKIKLKALGELLRKAISPEAAKKIRETIAGLEIELGELDVELDYLDAVEKKAGGVYEAAPEEPLPAPSGPQ